MCTYIYVKLLYVATENQIEFQKKEKYRILPCILLLQLGEVFLVPKMAENNN